MTRNFREEHRLNGIVYCDCVNCRAAVETAEEKEAPMNLPPDVKRAMEQVERDLKVWESVPQSIPDLLEELRRFERDPGCWLRKILAEQRAESIAKILAAVADRRNAELLTGAWPSLDAVGGEGGRATAEK